MSLVRNGQAKLTATYLNNLGVALAAVGAITPITSSLFGPEGPTLFILAVGALCIIGSGALHLIARRVLKGLEP